MKTRSAATGATPSVCREMRSRWDTTRRLSLTSQRRTYDHGRFHLIAKDRETVPFGETLL